MDLAAIRENPNLVRGEGYCLGRAARDYLGDPIGWNGKPMGVVGALNIVFEHQLNLVTLVDHYVGWKPELGFVDLFGHYREGFLSGGGSGFLGPDWRHCGRNQGA